MPTLYWFNTTTVKRSKIHFKFMQKNLKALCDEFTQQIKSFKKSVLISTNEFQDYGCSNHAISVCKKLKEINDDPDTFVSFQETIDMRNYLMVTICMVNCLRA